MHAIPPNAVLYAVGDVHGRDDLLQQLHERILEYHRLVYQDRPGAVVHVGDYIDRGPQSIQVIDRLMAGLEGLECVCLLGNHEAMALECLQSDQRQAWITWFANGGEATLNSLGVPLQFGMYDPAAFRDALGADRIAWLQSLPFSRIVGRYLLVHAGIKPGVPLEKQRPEDLLWIRGQFLDSDEDHGHVVVHGHTPGSEPVVRSNRICVDTGAVFSNLLVAAVLEADAPPIFLRAFAAPARLG